MDKKEIVVNLKGFEVLERKVSKFGTGAHIVLSRKHIGKKIKIIIGKSKIISKKISFDFFKSEILERKVSRFGTGAHVLVPKAYFGKKIKIIIGGENFH